VTVEGKVEGVALAPLPDFGAVAAGEATSMGDPQLGQ